MAPTETLLHQELDKLAADLEAVELKVRAGDQDYKMPRWNTDLLVSAAGYPEERARYRELIQQGRERSDAALLEYSRSLTAPSEEKAQAPQASSGKKTLLKPPSFRSPAPSAPKLAPKNESAPTEQVGRKALPAFGTLLKRNSGVTPETRASQNPPPPAQKPATPSHTLGPTSQARPPPAGRGAGAPSAYGAPAVARPVSAQTSAGRGTAPPTQTRPVQTPGTYSRVAPPIKGPLDDALVRDGWTRWQNCAGMPRTQTAKHEGGPLDGQTIKNAQGQDAVAIKLNPSEYGAPPGMDLGYCEGWFKRNHCDFENWEVCPLRHWNAEPIELRWHSDNFAKRMLRNRGPFLPPDDPKSRYNGRSRIYFNGTVFKPERFRESLPGMNPWFDPAVINQKAIPTPEQQAAQNVQPQSKEIFIQTGPKKRDQEARPSVLSKVAMPPKTFVPSKKSKSPAVPAGSSKIKNGGELESVEEGQGRRAKSEALDAKCNADIEAWRLELEKAECALRAQNKGAKLDNGSKEEKD
ncbi:hypothetical protein J4E80_006006 [Alternaria sp. BMP 0032]|nr:hypothetical protein J4E80_006006 [Alternaria sp. BMP 0032]